MKNVLYLLMAGLLISACDNSLFNQLPPATQEGRGIFGCKVNGEVWLPNKGAWFDQEPTAIVLDTSFSITATRNNETIQILINQPIFEDKLYELCCENIKYGLYIKDKEYYYAANDQMGEILITNYDSISEIISGTFWFDATNTAGNMIEVTDGRFDLIYK